MPSLEALEASETLAAEAALPPLLSSVIVPTNQSSSAAETDDDARAVLVEPAKLVDCQEPNCQTPDQEFCKGVIAAFVRGGKPSPTLQRIRLLQGTIPNKLEARGVFLDYLREKMPRIKHPGSLPHIAEEFNAAWPMLAEREQLMRLADAQRRGPQALTVGGGRRSLARSAAQLGGAYKVAATKLNQLSTQADLKIDHALESALEKLRAEMICIAESSVTAAERVELEAVPPELQLQALRMTFEERSGLKRQLFESRLIETRSLPRLSLLDFQSKS